MFGGFAVPEYGLLVVLWDALAFFVHEAKVILGLGIALFGGLSVPECSLLVVLGYTLAIFIHDAEVELGDCITLFGEGVRIFV